MDEVAHGGIADDKNPPSGEGQNEAVQPTWKWSERQIWSDAKFEHPQLVRVCKPFLSHALNQLAADDMAELKAFCKQHRKADNVLIAKCGTKGLLLSGFQGDQCIRARWIYGRSLKSYTAWGPYRDEL